MVEIQICTHFYTLTWLEKETFKLGSSLEPDVFLGSIVIIRLKTKKCESVQVTLTFMSNLQLTHTYLIGLKLVKKSVFLHRECQNSSHTRSILSKKVVNSQIHFWIPRFELRH